MGRKAIACGTCTKRKLLRLVKLLVKLFVLKAKPLLFTLTVTCVNSCNELTPGSLCRKTQLERKELINGRIKNCQGCSNSTHIPVSNNGFLIWMPCVFNRKGSVSGTRNITNFLVRSCISEEHLLPPLFQTRLIPYHTVNLFLKPTEKGVTTHRRSIFLQQMKTTPPPKISK